MHMGEKFHWPDDRCATMKSMVLQKDLRHLSTCELDVFGVQTLDEILVDGAKLTELTSQQSFTS